MDDESSSYYPPPSWVCPPHRPCVLKLQLLFKLAQCFYYYDCVTVISSWDYILFPLLNNVGFPPAPAQSWYIFVSLVFCLSVMISFPKSLMSSRHIFSQDIQKVLPVLSSILPLFSPSGLPSPTAPWTSGLVSPLACLCVQFHVSWMIRHPLFEVVPSFQGFVGLLPPTVHLPVTCWEEGLVRVIVCIPCVSLCWALGGPFQSG